MPDDFMIYRTNLLNEDRNRRRHMVIVSLGKNKEKILYVELSWTTQRMAYGSKCPYLNVEMK